MWKLEDGGAGKGQPENGEIVDGTAHSPRVSQTPKRETGLEENSIENRS